MPAEIRKSRSDENTQEADETAVKKTQRALKPRVTDVVPHHPALDIPVEQKAYTRRAGVDWVVFGVTAAIALAFLVWGFVSTDSLATASSNALGWVMADVGWLFVLTASGFVVFVIWLAMSRYGNIPLGRDDDEPEFRTVSWVAMMFSAGMGIGLMFFGVSEPLSHFASPPPGTGEPGNPEAAQTAMATTMFHWTLHPWAIYAVVGLTIAYGVYRKGRLQLVSAAFEPLLGKRANGPWGKVIDMLAIFATLFGSAASLGLGALQIRSGLHIVAGIGETGNAILIIIITVLTIAFVLSAVSGVARGIQWLSNTNMVLALAMALFIFLVGPTMFMLNMIPTAIGSYIGDLPQMAARTGAEGPEVSAWLQDWTIFYWAWWISWTPFVGMFIARISRGRTIRQFVTGVLLVPSVVSLVWFCVFGGAAIFEQQNGVDLAGMGSQERQLFSLLGEYPIATVTSVVVMVLVAIFFVSGADAASIVMGSLSERGTIKPTRPTVIFWGVATGAVAAVMLLVGGADALNGLQSITIIVAVPFVLVMIGLAVALVRDLREDPLVVRRQYAVEAVSSAVVSGVTQHGDDFVISVEKDPHADEKQADAEKDAEAD
ncbi:BCCT family transporter [Mycolicibacterium septicum]|uniref:BCCT family transporter n=1 Tax=Mycolicibacterium septicum TaxID=98668 RepID=UPI0023E154B6|nr:BCCT family transporter [Mycolicibacterium septicum]MDF3337162.1 BCCT family transporter [Mycolicibacterium septicum]